jgi:hypothetical protein
VYVARLTEGVLAQFKSFLTSLQFFRFFMCFGLIETPKLGVSIRSETFDTNVLFRIVPKLFSVPVSVV